MSDKNNLERDVKTWLLTVFKNENISDLSVNIEGNSEKGDGYGGDVVFVQASGLSYDNQIKKYDLVIKCSKRNEALRKAQPIKQVFLNEIHVYENVLPYFTKFQREKDVTDIFTSFPKYYGSIVGEDYEIIVLEDLKKKGYNLWSKKDPLPRKHLSLVLGEYAKYHATSLALQKQRPEEYKRLASGLVDTFSQVNFSRMQATFDSIFEEVAQLLKDEIDEADILKWKKLLEELKDILDSENMRGTRVLVHGDCWNNNFMFKEQDFNKYLPKQVSIIDWQVSKSTSLILDLSYFLFTCISKHEINDINNLLKEYHKKLTEYLKELGSDASVVYPIEQLFTEWKMNCRYGIVVSTLIMKICSAAKEEVAESVAESVMGKIENENNFKKRMKPIVEFITKNNLI